ncbi:MAG: 30S ribosomal protein S21 [Pelagibacterales bacterium]|nr:30S ribosomal protein S21 [Pelagibacterales bacterium]
MLIVEVLGGKIDKAIKQLRRKVNKTKLKKILRDKRYFNKKSQVKRLLNQKAVYLQKKLNEDDV